MSSLNAAWIAHEDNMQNTRIRAIVIERKYRAEYRLNVIYYWPRNFGKLTDPPCAIAPS